MAKRVAGETAASLQTGSQRDGRKTALRRRVVGLHMTGVRQRVPEMPLGRRQQPNGRHQQQVVNLKLAQGLSLGHSPQRAVRDRWFYWPPPPAGGRWV